MLCPVDQTALTMSERQGIEIDYCPTCRGVWLDRGELDKLIERSNSYQAESHPPAPPAIEARRDDRRDEPRRDDRGRQPDDRGHYNDRSYHDDHRSRDSHSDSHHKRKKEGFLGDIFDFGD